MLCYHYTQHSAPTHLDGSPAGAADGDAHPVVAAEAVQLVELLRGVAGARLHLPRAARQLDAAARAVEVVRAVVLWRWRCYILFSSYFSLSYLAAELKGLSLDGGVAFLAHVPPLPSCFHLRTAKGQHGR